MQTNVLRFAEAIFSVQHGTDKASAKTKQKELELRANLMFQFCRQKQKMGTLIETEDPWSNVTGISRYGFNHDSTDQKNPIPKYLFSV